MSTWEPARYRVKDLLFHELIEIVWVILLLFV